MPIHTLGAGQRDGQNQGQGQDRLPVQPPQAPLGPGFRRGTNDFAATGRQPPNAGAGPGGGAGGGGQIGVGGQGPGQTVPVQAEPPPKEKVSSSDPVLTAILQKNRGQTLTAYQLKQFDYRYDDTDTIMNELSEFYPYLEMPGIVENAEKFKQHFNARKPMDPWWVELEKSTLTLWLGWTEMSYPKKRRYVEEQLEHMESPVYTTRREAQSRIVYLLQGKSCLSPVTSVAGVPSYRNL